MASTKERILEKLEELPEPALREVLDFIEFLHRKEESVDNPLLDVAGILSGHPVSSSEIDRELYGNREAQP